MSSSSLADYNPEYSVQNGIYVAAIGAEQQASVRHNDLSSYLSIAVPKLFERTDDVSLFSYELETQLDTPELQHEFEPAKHNLLRAVNFDQLTGAKRSLDLAQDMGGVANCLSEKFEHVDSIKRCSGRASLSIKRNNKCRNITTFCSDIDDLSLPANHYDFIYVGNVSELGLNLSEARVLLSSLNNSLTKDGVLTFYSPNPNRLSRYLQSNNDEFDSKTPYASLYQDECVTRFTLESLTDYLGQHPTLEASIHASYSATGQVSNLLSSHYLTKYTHADNHFYRLGSVDNADLCEYLAYQSMQREGHELISLASGFTVLVAKSKQQLDRFYDNDFTHFAGKSRRPFWRTITSKARTESVVKKHATLPSFDPDSTLLTQDTSPQEFVEGKLLVADWLSAILDQDLDRFSVLVDQYYAWLVGLQSDDRLPENAYDLLPFNLLIDAEGAIQSIDREWQLKGKFDAKFVLFRALFWFAFENKSTLVDFAERYSLSNFDAFIMHFLNTKSRPLSREELKGFVDLEENLQSLIGRFFKAGSIELAMQHRLVQGGKNAVRMLAKCSATWAAKNDDFRDETTVYMDWEISSDPQTIKLRLPKTNADYPILRVDPIDNQGLFVFHELTLLDGAEEEVLNIHGADIARQSTPRNAVENGAPSSTTLSYSALNDDPFLLFDLSSVNDLGNIRSVMITISLPFEPNYQASLETLQNLVAEQSDALRQLSNKGHERQADVDVLSVRLSASEHTRTELANQLARLEHVQQENEALKQRLNSSLIVRIVRALKRRIKR